MKMPFLLNLSPLTWLKFSLVAGLLAIVGNFYFDNQKLKKEITTLNNDKITLATNFEILNSAHNSTLLALKQLKKDNEKSKKIIADLNSKTESDANLVASLIQKIDESDKSVASDNLKNAIIATKEIK